MIGMFYISSNAFMLSCIMLFECFRWTSFFCYLWSSSLVMILCVFVDAFHQWQRQREIERWISGEEDDEDD